MMSSASRKNIQSAPAANAEATPFPDDAFDLAISEYGASLWCDPEAWIPEAARILRPGGELVFLTNSVLSVLCLGAAADDVVDERLARPQRGLLTREEAIARAHRALDEFIVTGIPTTIPFHLSELQLQCRLLALVGAYAVEGIENRHFCCLERWFQGFWRGESK